MTGLTNLEIYNYFSNITEESNKFKLYTDNIDKFSFAELNEELEEKLGFSDITTKRLQHDVAGPRTIQAYRKVRSEKQALIFFSCS